MEGQHFDQYHVSMPKFVRVIGAVFLVALIALPYEYSYLVSLATTVNVLIPEGSWRPLLWITKTPQKATHIVQSSSGRNITINVYSPKQLFRGKTQTALIIYTPFIAGGLEDARLVNLAQTFARAGFIVLVPWSAQDRLVVSQKDVEDIVTTAGYAITTYDVQEVGIFGISYGVGPVFTAAADQRIAHVVPFIISLNGYSSIERVIDFISTGTFSYKDIQGHADPDPYTKEILDVTLAALNTDRSSWASNEEFESLKHKLSPEQHLDSISADVFIIHSTSDTYIPYTESIRLHDMAQGSLQSTLVLTDVVEHGKYLPLSISNMQHHYLPALYSFYSMIHTIRSTYR